MVDLSLMRSCHVDMRARVATVDGGCLLGDIDRETALYGWVVVRLVVVVRLAASGGASQPLWREGVRGPSADDGTLVWGILCGTCGTGIGVS